jgi:glyoxylase-like metal-dependent hydrolase (beta-lactamase superfamily II)
MGVGMRSGKRIVKSSKIIIFLLMALIGSSHTYLYAEQNNDVYQLSDELQIRPIAKDAFLVTHSFPWPANSLLVRHPGRYIVWVDTPYTDSGTEQVWKWIKSNLGDETIIEVNTGFHSDNLGGNGFLLEKSIDIYGTDLIVTMLNNQSEITRAQILKWLEMPKFKKHYNVHSTATYHPPNKVITININEGVYLLDGLVEVYYPGPSHSKDNLIVYFPDKKLLFGGCAVKSVQSKNLGFIGDAVISQWPRSLKRVLNRYSDALLVVPGHGKVGGLELIKHTLALF